MLVEDIRLSGETVGQFIWRVAISRILTEEYTDQIGVALGETLAAKMPLRTFLPWKTILVWLVDRTLPEYGLLALRRILEVTKLAAPGDPYFLIPGLDDGAGGPSEGNG